MFSLQIVDGLSVGISLKNPGNLRSLQFVGVVTASIFSSLRTADIGELTIDFFWN